MDPFNCSCISNTTTTTSENDCTAETLEGYDFGWHIGAIFFVLFASIIGIVLPLLQRRFGKWKSFEFLFVCGKHLGTGVLLSLAFIHLLFPAVELLGSPCNGGSWTEYPFAMLFCLIAVLFMHMIELVAHIFIASRGLNHDDVRGLHIHDTDGCHIEHDFKESCVNISEFQNKPVSSKSTEALKTKSHEHKGAHVHGILITSKAERTVSAYLLEFSLAIHSVIIGITVGVAADSELAALIPVLCFHQLFEGIALGAMLAEVGFTSFKQVMLVLIFSFSAPIGIAIGIGIHSSYDANSATANITQGTLEAVSAGILLYVAFVSLLGQEFPKDFEQCGSSWKRIALFVSLWSGAAILAAFGNWL